MLLQLCWLSWLVLRWWLDCPFLSCQDCPTLPSYILCISEYISHSGLICHCFSDKTEVIVDQNSPGGGAKGKERELPKLKNQFSGEFETRVAALWLYAFTALSRFRFHPRSSESYKILSICVEFRHNLSVKSWVMALKCFLWPLLPPPSLEWTQFIVTVCAKFQDDPSRCYSCPSCSSALNWSFPKQPVFFFCLRMTQYSFSLQIESSQH